MRSLLCFVFVISVSSQASATLLTNGGFEEPVVVGGNQSFGSGSTAITGWTVSGNVDVNEGGPTVLGESHSGKQNIDINGSPGPGAVDQSFATTPGASYLVSLFYSNNPNPSEASPPYSASISVIGGSTLFSETVVHSDAAQGAMNWLPFERSFVADSATTTLRLQSLQGGYNGVYFDTVSVTDEISNEVANGAPEPSSLLLAALGMLSLCMRRRRR